MSPPKNAEYNPGRPDYDILNLPIRDEVFYWDTICRLQGASKTKRDDITRETGISRMPLCAASPAFIHPTFFPLDPFHLFYENCMAWIWDLWMTNSKPPDPIHINGDKASIFGGLVVEAMSSLPACFCSPVRDPHLKRNSQYKIYEWMALLHWYIIPIGIELGFNSSVLENFSYFVEAVEMAMTVLSRSKEDLTQLKLLFAKFLMGFERIYVDNNPENVSRCRLCIFQLIHVPTHIVWNGSIRAGSQATVERAIGEVGHKIRSAKAPFANLANILLEKELVKLLILYHPSLDSSPVNHISNGPQQQIKIRKYERAPDKDFYHHLRAICLYLHMDFDPELEVQRWGKFRLSDGNLLRSRLGETQAKPPSRSARYFEAQTDGAGTPVFGEAIAFFEVISAKQCLLVYCPLHKCQKVLTTWKGAWSNSLAVLPAPEIQRIVGIWSYSGKVYVLRKHPGLAFLSKEESGQENDSDNIENDQNNDESFM